MPLYCPRYRAQLVLLAAVLLAAAAAHAAHPLVTEDTGTQGAGNVELELGNSWGLDHGAHVYAFAPQVSLGSSSNLDLIVQPSWLDSRTPPATRVQGPGDTNLDAKWRFFGQAPMSLGVRAGIEAPTAATGLGLSRTGYHAVAVATWDTAPLTLHGNLGYAFVPEGAGGRSNVYHASAAAMFAYNESLIFVAEGATDSSPVAVVGTRPAVALAGVIYTARPGVDLDLGYLTGVNSAAAVHRWLLGVTIRWAP